MATKRLSKILTWISPSSNTHNKNDQSAVPSQAKSATTTARTAPDVKADVNGSSKDEWKNLPTFDELPMFKNMKGCAWDVWGNTDQLGTINLLTEEVVRQAAAEEIL